jgi:hypothetical protein
MNLRVLPSQTKKKKKLCKSSMPEERVWEQDAARREARCASVQSNETLPRT